MRLCIVSHWDMEEDRCLRICLVGMAWNVAHKHLSRQPPMLAGRRTLMGEPQVDDSEVKETAVEDLACGRRRDFV